MAEMEVGEELQTFIKIWLMAISSICYCYFIPAQIPHGFSRLLSLLPVITLFFILPLPISTVHLAFPTVFFLVWLGNFKLLLFAFNRGPLSSKPQLPIHTFVCIALLPISLKQSNKKLSDTVPTSSHKPVSLAVKAVILTVAVNLYQFKDSLHWTCILFLHHLHMYFGCELILAITALFVKIIHRFDIEIEPQFNEPHLATSLQDLWGRRWNLMASSILQASVYDPIRTIWTPVLGRHWGQLLAILATFVVSGLMHDLMFLYLTRVPPTWEVTWFLVLMGVCTVVEVAVKKAVNGRWRLHKAVSGPLTVAFVVVTGGYLFFPQLERNGVSEKVMNENSIMLKCLGLK